MAEKPDCETCRTYHHEIKKDTPDCRECMPVLLAKNQDALEVFSMCSNQAIVAGMAGVILDINFDAVCRVMDLYGVEDKKACFKKVVHVFRHMRDKQREEQEHK